VGTVVCCSVTPVCCSVLQCVSLCCSVLLLRCGVWGNRKLKKMRFAMGTALK